MELKVGEQAETLEVGSDCGNEYAKECVAAGIRLPCFFSIVAVFVFDKLETTFRNACFANIPKFVRMFSSIFKLRF